MQAYTIWTRIGYEWRAQRAAAELLALGVEPPSRSPIVVPFQRPTRLTLQS